MISSFEGHTKPVNSKLECRNRKKFKKKTKNWESLKRSLNLHDQINYCGVERGTREQTERRDYL